MHKIIMPAPLDPYERYRRFSHKNAQIIARAMRIKAIREKRNTPTI